MRRGIIVFFIVAFFSTIFVVLVSNVEKRNENRRQLGMEVLDVEEKTENSSNNVAQTYVNIEGKSIDVIPNPDEIIYYLGEKEIIIDKNNKKYLKILEMNKTRAQYAFTLLQMNIPSATEINKHKDKYLAYKYDEGCLLYFTLRTSNDEVSTQYIIIGKDNKHFESGVYGFSSLPCDELIEILKK